MQITIDTSLGAISDLDRRVLGVLLGEPEAPPKPAAPAPTPVPQASKPAPEPVVEPEVPEAPEPVQETPEDDEVTQADVVRVATELVSAGKSSEVREILSGMGFNKVSAVKSPGDLATLMQELNKLR